MSMRPPTDSERTSSLNALKNRTSTISSSPYVTVATKQPERWRTRAHLGHFQVSRFPKEHEPPPTLVTTGVTCTLHEGQNVPPSLWLRWSFIGLPQFGHDSALLLISFPHSEHFTSAIVFHPFPPNDWVHSFLIPRSVIPVPPYLIAADVCVPKLHGNSAHPLSSIKTYHYQAQLIEICTVSLEFSK
jgi:hypothetical protein